MLDVKKSFIFLSLVCFSASTYAFNWVKVFESKFRSSYVDTEKISKSRDNVVFWTLTDYGNNNNLSSISKFKVNCLEGKKTHLYFSYYHEPMGKGRKVSEDEWEKSVYPKPNSEAYDLMIFACNHEK